MASLTKAKAKKILADGKANGKRLSAKQKKFFKALSSGLFSKKKGKKNAKKKGKKITKKKKK